MSSLHAEITVDQPDLAAALCLLGAVVAIDAWALRSRRATISRWCRHTLRRRPLAAGVTAVLLALHLAVESDRDPARWLAARLTEGSNR